MKRADLAIGTEVYHRTMVHWGKGKITKVRTKDIFGYKIAETHCISWEYQGETWARPAVLRKTPNKKKIRAFLDLIAEQEDREELTNRLRGMLD